MSQIPAPQHTQRHRAESFGSVAGEYDAVRPSYPAALIDDLVAARPQHVLDVGCGTGRAAVLLQARGLDVLGVEIDPAMADVARGHGIAVEVSGFEDWDDAGRRFDLVVSGQAWHWIDPDRGRDALARVMRPGARLGLFWNIGALSADVQASFDEVYARHVPELVSTNAGRRAQAPLEVYLSDDSQLVDTRFVDVRTVDYPWRQDYTAAEWVRLVQTHSDHVVLDPQLRARLLGDLAAMIEGMGGIVELSYLTRTVFATRSGVAG